ncbi:hypothetical protein C8J57DRAFT_1718540 [Mycena rebaudengoi]|nr:hypothetical protein C8J57DRAFT_1718540 [Mycena rebaudengoi]
MRFDPALVTPTSADVAPPEFIGCPAPIAGFVRSPALWRQIEFLSKPDSHTRDYHFDTGPNRTRSIRIQDPGLRISFLVARRRAMASGDPRAVRNMHQILSTLQRAGILLLTPVQITGQLEREYRVQLRDDPASGGAFGDTTNSAAPRAGGDTPGPEDTRFRSLLEMVEPMPTPRELLEEASYAARRDRVADAADASGEAAEDDSEDIVDLANAREMEQDEDSNSESGPGSECGADDEREFDAPSNEENEGMPTDNDDAEAGL